MRDFTPQAGSAWIGAATGWIATNGARPGRLDGAGPDCGAVEVP